MRQILLITALFCALTIHSKEYVYTWSEIFPKYESQTPKSDFDTPDGLFRFISDKNEGINSPIFKADKHANLLLRLYAKNTLVITCLKDEKMTKITLVIGSSTGHSKVANLIPSNGSMEEPYLGKDSSNSFREYRQYWIGNTEQVTFTIGDFCTYGYDCLENGKEGISGNLITKQIIIETRDKEDKPEDASAIDNPIFQAQRAVKVLQNGYFLIIRNNDVYNSIGSKLYTIL